MCPGKYFEMKSFFQNIIVFTLFADFEWRNSGRWQTFSTRVWKPKFEWPEEHFEKNSSHEDTILYFSIIFPGKHCFAIKLLVRQEGILGVQRNFPKDNFLEKTKIFKIWGSELYSLGLLPKQIWQKCQNFSPCDQRSFRSKMIFVSKKHFESFSQHLAEEFRTVGKNYNLGCQTDNYVSTSTSN